VKPVVIGIVVIGLGTSAPELLVSASAAARGETGIAVGNIVGSNILNLTLILGVAALVRGVRVQASVITREARLAVAAVMVFAVLAWIGLSRLAGVVLAVLLAGALAVLIRWALSARSTDLAAEVHDFTGIAPADHQVGDLDTDSTEDTLAGDVQDDEGAGTVPVHRVGLETARALIGLAGVLLGAQLLVANAATIAARFGVPHVVIGLTLVALGTSLPELVTTVQAQRRGESDLVVGNLFGSNLFNSLGGGAVVGLTAGSASPDVSAVFVVTMVATAVLAWVLLRRGLRLSRPEGLILLSAYALTLPLLLSS
jgi:cation:H+ antiporter